MKRLLLAGAGHAHLNVLRNLAMQRWPDVEVTLICPYPRQIYSGMIPGWIAGHYTLEQCAAPLAGLVEKSGIHWIQDSICGLDADTLTVNTEKSGKFTADVMSFDTGAQVLSAPFKAAGKKLLAIRPLEQFVIDWERQKAKMINTGSARLIVVGGGAAGVELALAMAYAMRRHLPAKQVTVRLLSSGPLLDGHPKGVVRRVEKILDQHRITRLEGRASGHPDGLQLASGEHIASDCIVAATGVAPPAWLASSGLALCQRGFIAVGDGQQSTSHPRLFAAGDVASRIDAPHAKSGVYAVRAGPVLTMNLQRALNGEPPAHYQPQSRTLYLLATGPREAVLSWGQFSAAGSWAWTLKDWIDRRFMRQYQT